MNDPNLKIKRATLAPGHGMDEDFRVDGRLPPVYSLLFAVSHLLF